LLIDITLKVTPQMIRDAHHNEQKSFDGHLGTHFDVMDQEFPLSYTQRKAVVFDVSGVKDRDIETDDIEILKIEPQMFVAFHTGFLENTGYGSKAYFTRHPQLSENLVEELLKIPVSIIGLDFAGMRRGKQHLPWDQHCAQKGVFVIENLCNLAQVLAAQPHALFNAHTYPLNYAGMTGLPCRVVAQI